MKYFTYNCGCKFPVNKVGDITKIDFDPSIENLNFECSKTWDLISEGNTKGVFQLESRLGKTTAKKLKPENIEQLAALISILRPGTLEAIRDGKSVTNHYIDKKNGLESVDYFHTCLEPILNTTYGEMVYQEQAMEIAKVVAGFDLQEADMLRKAIGKKKPEEMAKVKKKFIKGSKKLNIVTKEEAEEIFGWIEKSQRYSFNKSHAISYAINAYLSAYAKAHFPRVFFASYLRFAKDKIDPQQEIKELTRNAAEMNIDVCIPDFRNLNEFFILKDKRIYFGLTDIKGVGKSVFLKILDICTDKNIKDFNWLEILFEVLLNINSTASKALISCGAFDYFRKNRTEMLFEYDICSSLTKKEYQYTREIISIDKTKNLKEILEKVKQHKKVNKNRQIIIDNLIKSINKPAYSLVDKIDWLSESENALLGVSITCSKIDSYDISMTNCNCKTFKTTLTKDKLILAGEISNINITKTKNGKNPGQEMAFISIEDQYGLLDSVILFPEKLTEYRNHLFVNNVLVFVGTKSKNKDTLIVEKCFMPAT
jgi:DNA polymerase III subunit alpha